MKHEDTASAHPAVAIIGMGGMFAGSENLDAYWRILLGGIDCITDPPEGRQDLNDYFSTDPKQPDHIYCKRGGFLPNIAFDPTEFGIPPAAIEATDTSQLLGLVGAKMALADAGYGDDKEGVDHQRTSVILGVTGTQELVIALGSRLGHPVWRRAISGKGLDDRQKSAIMDEISDSYVSWQENSFPGLLGNVVAGRICNRLNLGGTNCGVDAACASSLGAIHLALLELYTGNSDMVVTGGVDTLNDIFMHMCFSKTGVLSHTGDARPFSENADGTVLGEGIGMLVLKRLDDAQRDNDRIYAVIRGIGASSDGKSQSIYAPRADGQARALSAAYAHANVPPETIGLVEAHGTGTRVGDGVEFSALKKVFALTGRTRKCALGSVKSMIGHAKAAAGAAGVIKSALALYHKVLPPTLKADTPDPKLDIANSPFYLNTSARPWFKNGDAPRRSGVSAFGFGGSNFHLVLEEYQAEKTDVAWDGAVELLALSAPDNAGLARSLADLTTRLGTLRSEMEIRYQAGQSRKHFNPDHPHRLVMVMDRRKGQAALDTLLSAASGVVAENQTTMQPSRRIYYCAGDAPTGKMAFLFPGQGSQYPDMGKDLVCRFPEAMAEIAAAGQEADGEAFLWDRIFPIPPASDEDRQRQETALRQTDVAQPAIGVVSLAMLAVLARFGIFPDAVAGHSYGELVALAAAGRMDSDTLRRLSVLRGRLMAEAGNNKDAGAMLAVFAAPDGLDDLLHAHPDVVLANVNSPDQSVLSGPVEAISAVQTACAKNNLKTVLLPVAAAFHSPLVAAAQRPFAQAVAATKFSAGNISVYANVTGGAYPDDLSAAADLLGRQLASPVLFQQMIEQMVEDGVRVFVEVGPRAVLSGLVRSIVKTRTDANAITLLALDPSAGKDGIMDLAQVVAQLAAMGRKVDLAQWERPVPEPRTRKMTIPLAGKNYRAPQPKKSAFIPMEAPAPKPAMPVATASGPAAAGPPVFPVTPPLRSQAMNDYSNAEKKTALHIPATAASSGIALHDALAIVQKGLESIQSLHQQTAAAHQKFLDTQAMAGRTLESMMQSTRDVVASMATGLPQAVSAPMASQPTVSIAAASTPAAPVMSAPPRAPLVSSPLALVAAPSPAASPSSNVTLIQDTLVGIISDLTGYPREMLGLDQDIESDLGIDSIKRVEILSTMEEQMPDLPTVTPDLVGTLKTIGQICDFLTAGSSSKNPPQPSAPVSAMQRSQAGTSEIQDTLVGIISDLTGYPRDMLGLDQDIESDLGIDSIKRVEILSTLEEQMPDLPTVTPDLVGTLKTIGQICDFLVTGAGSGNPLPQTEPASSQPAAQPKAQTNIDQVQDVLVGIISDLTGYPRDMLGLDQDIESDLGIDSIKRVEILSTLEERMPQLPTVTPDRVGTLKTIGQICDFLVGEKTLQAPDSGLAEPVLAGTDVENDIARRIVDIADAPAPKGRIFSMTPDRFVAVVHRRTSLGPALVRQFEQKGISARLIFVDTDVDAAMFEGAAGVVLCPDVPPEAAFLTAKHAAPALFEASRPEAGANALFAAVTTLDGAFGFTGNRFSHPEQAALCGLVKTAALEWEAVRCRAIDLSPDTDGETAARQVVAELTETGPDAVEIGFSGSRRICLKTVPAAISTGPLTLDSRHVVVVTGGARGVTAACALALARETGVSLALVGRSGPPVAIPDWLAGIEDEAAMKKTIAKHGFLGSRPTPKELAAAYATYAASRAVTRTLSDLGALGVKAAYFSADVTDKDGLSHTLETIRSQMGPIAGVIHGAGILHDRLITDKTLSQFRDVYATKVGGLQNILDATEKDDLQYLVVFSSVAARTGNIGQCDYAMANEVLNKTARLESLKRKNCRVTAINWGPWDGGMVTPSLKRAFGEKQIALIPLEKGADLMVAEMKNIHPAPVEVVVGTLLSTPSDPTSQNPSDDAFTLMERRELNLSRYPILESHIINGRPVVPFALMSEWIGRGALKGSPGYCFHGIDDFRLLSGIRMDREAKLVRLMAGKPRKAGDLWQVEVELRNGVKNGSDVIHSRAKALLTHTFPEAPFFSATETPCSPYARDLDEIYDRILFHGKHLRAIQAIYDYTDTGMTARLVTAPAPAAWMADAMDDHWTADPMVLDGAFQMAIVWCFEQTGNVCLPSYAKAYRQYRSVFPENGVRAVMTVGSRHHRKMIADFVFLDEGQNVVATLEGYEATIDANLMHAFRNNRLAPAAEENAA